MIFMERLSVGGLGFILKPREHQYPFLGFKLRLETICLFFPEGLIVVSSGHPRTTQRAGAMRCLGGNNQGAPSNTVVNQVIAS